MGPRVLPQREEQTMERGSPPIALHWFGLVWFGQDFKSPFGGKINLLPSRSLPSLGFCETVETGIGKVGLTTWNRNRNWTRNKNNM